MLKRRKNRKIRKMALRMGFVFVFLASIVLAKEWLPPPSEEENDPELLTPSPEKHAPLSIALPLKDMIKPDVTPPAQGLSSPLELDAPPLTLDLPSDLAEIGDNTGFESLSLEPFDINLPPFGIDYAAAGNAVPFPISNGLWASASELPFGLPDFGIFPVIVPKTLFPVAIEQVPEPSNSFLVVIGVVSLLATLKFRRLQSV
jgi:hypothetical protein